MFARRQEGWIAEGRHGGAFVLKGPYGKCTTEDKAEARMGATSGTDTFLRCV